LSIVLLFSLSQTEAVTEPAGFSWPAAPPFRQRAAPMETNHSSAGYL